MKGAPRSLRIALLTHSTNPRGGVVHALELAEALVRSGQQPVVFAPDADGRGFFREAACPTVTVPATPAPDSLYDMIVARSGDYVRFFSDGSKRPFDVWHAQDGISAYALAELKQRGAIPGFARTVHHVDTFEEPRIAALQTHGIETADRLLVVSKVWQEALETTYGRSAVVVGNGVDLSRFNPEPDARSDRELRKLISLGDGAVFLAIGGIEARKNTIGILAGFAQCRSLIRNSKLIIAGGASLLDHSAYRREFDQVLESACLPKDAVVVTGPLPQHLMPALYRRASALVFPSFKEGFGLVVLEAMASGIPVITSRIRPFTDLLETDDVLWCAPDDSTSIAEAMIRAVEHPVRPHLVARGLAIAKRHSWDDTARAHLAVYQDLKESCHA